MMHSMKASIRAISFYLVLFHILSIMAYDVPVRSPSPQIFQLSRSPHRLRSLLVRCCLS